MAELAETKVNSCCLQVYVRVAFLGSCGGSWCKCDSFCLFYGLALSKDCAENCEVSVDKDEGIFVYVVVSEKLISGKCVFYILKHFFMSFCPFENSILFCYFM